MDEPTPLPILPPELGGPETPEQQPSDERTATPSWQIPYVLPADPVAGYPPVSQALAERIDACLSALQGGTQVQVYQSIVGGGSFPLNGPASGAGPVLNGLPSGNYILIVGVEDAAGVNGGVVTLTPAFMQPVIDRGSVDMRLVKNWAGGSLSSVWSGNGGGTGGSFVNMYLLAIRYANQSALAERIGDLIDGALDAENLPTLPDAPTPLPG